MTDKQQIEEIQQILIGCCNYVDENGNILGNKCSNCEHWDDTNNVCCSYERKQAEALYKARYCKVDENAVVLTREEYDSLMGNIAKITKAWSRAMKEAERLHNIKIDLEHQLTQKGLTEYVGADVIEAETRKKTARKIIHYIDTEIGNYINDSDLQLFNGDIKWLKEQHGVEVEDNGN